jgi:hypothetical protein
MATKLMVNATMAMVSRSRIIRFPTYTVHVVV